MSANVETMFSARELPWHGLGTVVADAVNSKEAITLAGLDWKVEQRELIDSVTGEVIPNFLANVRDSDNRVLGIVSGSRYRVCQNLEAFEFTDNLLGEGEVKYETAGSLFGGRRIWLLAKLPEVKVLGDDICPYLVFMNSHDGSSGVRAAITPVRVVCNNTLNLALSRALRTWSCGHRGDLQGRLMEATNTLKLSNWYMKNFDYACQDLAKIKVDPVMAEKLIGEILPIKKDDGHRKAQNIREMRSDILTRFMMSPDLSEVGDNGYKFINAISDYENHNDLHPETKNYDENRFYKIASGNGLLIDRAMKVLKSA